jgi:hypothetical protein
LLPRLLLAALLPLTSLAADHTWTVTAQGGYSNTFQMTLGGCFGQGPYLQDRLTAGLGNVFRSGDALTVFGWSGTDLPKRRVNWQTGIGYRSRILAKSGHSLLLTGGFQRWNLPGVKTGTRDWLVAGTLNYSGKIRRLPVLVQQDSWSLLASSLPTGSLVYTQIQTQSTLVKRDRLELLVRHGVHHTYSWNFYGANGNRVVRYGATLILNWKNTTFEGGCRQQFGLQDGIPYNRYWSFQVSRSISGRFGRRG